MSYAFMADPPPPPRRRFKINWLLVGGIGAAGAIAALLLMRTETIVERPNEVRTTRVILPPPPPPPPPKPLEDTPEPVPTPTPMEQPVDTPPPETPALDATPGEDALTAREGVGPSNYGLARGDGSGTRIGGRPGGGAQQAYGARIAGRVRAALRPLRVKMEDLRLSVWVSPSGRIERVDFQSTGDAELDARIRQLVAGLDVGETPPASLTQPVLLRARIQ